ncbi:hypothetical protein DPMN_159302 [Dreissena polymorpha]|uniref:Uncharacterized protein n=1 Tax=Dreissena polymorpha TaxID=45954 RepID=A0A9D4EP49_DREPO|nr:hypothetical protein DPMN_159302 [Dreissena polymorpha]
MAHARPRLETHSSISGTTMFSAVSYLLLVTFIGTVSSQYLYRPTRPYPANAAHVAEEIKFAHYQLRPGRAAHFSRRTSSTQPLADAKNSSGAVAAEMKTDLRRLKRARLAAVEHVTKNCMQPQYS